MGLDHFFDKNLVFCLEADNQEHLFDQVATLIGRTRNRNSNLS